MVFREVRFHAEWNFEFAGFNLDEPVRLEIDVIASAPALTLFYAVHFRHVQPPRRVVSVYIYAGRCAGRWGAGDAAGHTWRPSQDA